MTMRLEHALLPVLLLVSGCARDAGESQERAVVATAAEPAQEVTQEPQDSAIFEEKMAWARAQRLDTLPIGAAMAAIGRTFVGAPYTPGTLELPGPERLVINLRELDCVTFVENVLVLARMVRAGQHDYDSYKRELIRIRYRDGRLNGYPSRLHYFSEWISNNEEKGIVENITRKIGGVRDTGDIRFMTTHVEAYRQLQDETVVREIRAIEERLSDVERFYIPQGRIAAVANRIQDGDVIAATSTLPGLDIAHTGLALWIDGALHLMHAPLVGSVVEISERPLAERIQRIQAQDGIMVARPL